jgi:peptide/nickel transport system ATP-binding protein
MSSFVRISSLSKSFSSPPSLFTKIAKTVARKPVETQRVYAVNGVNLTVETGEILGLVGESGCGKSTLGRMVAGILEPSEGEIRLDGQPMVRSGAESVHNKVQMVFQNPYASLNPRHRILDTLTEAAIYRGLIARRDARQFAADMLQSVGLDPAYADRYPHQFSGGQRQRIAIARALAMNPRLIVCDEAVSALDVSVQAQILNLFLDLREQRQLTYLFISHNLSVVEYLADRVAIMYLGRVVELASTAALFDQPNHPYTKALIADAPRLDVKAGAYRPIQGELPSPLKPPSGCTFHPRCPSAMERCSVDVPLMRETAPGHYSACHLNEAASTIQFIPKQRSAA